MKKENTKGKFIIIAVLAALVMAAGNIPRSAQGIGCGIT